jgi:hypothetical protein
VAAELQKRMEMAEAELQLVKQQKRAAVGAEVQRQRKLEEQLSMQTERVRLANLRARAASQTRPKAGLSEYEYGRKAQPQTTSIDRHQATSPDATRLREQETYTMEKNASQKRQSSDAANMAKAAAQLGSQTGTSICGLAQAQEDENKSETKLSTVTAVARLTAAPRQRLPGSAAVIRGVKEKWSSEGHAVQDQVIPQATAATESVPDESEQDAQTVSDQAQTRRTTDQEHDGGARTSDSEPLSPASPQQGTDSSAWASAGRRLLQLG